MVVHSVVVSCQNDLVTTAQEGNHDRRKQINLVSENLAVPRISGAAQGLGIAMTMLVGGVGLAFGGHLFAEQRRYSYQVDFGSACQEVPALVNVLEVRHYAGTVVDHPSDDGYWGDNGGPNRTLGAIVFVQTEDRERSLTCGSTAENGPGSARGVPSALSLLSVNGLSPDRGTPVHVVQQTLSHASLTTTSRYTHARAGQSAGTYLAA